MHHHRASRFRSKNSLKYHFIFKNLLILHLCQVFIQGLQNINRSIQDDIVAIEILPKEDWVAPSALVLNEKEEQFEDEEQNKKVMSFSFFLFITAFSLFFP